MNISQLDFEIVIETEFQHAYDFEIFDFPKSLTLFKRFRPLLYTIIGLYLTGIYFGQKWMKNRPAYNLGTTLAIWNAGLALYSIVSTIRAFPEAAFLFSQPNGLYQVLCIKDGINYATVFWGLMFSLSKIVELGDTAFIVLRKQKLIFLHWYHHLTMLVFSWLGYELTDSTAAKMYFVNTFVHSIMYSYYALKALKIKVPKRVAMTITTLQIIQMVVAVSVHFRSMHFVGQGLPCGRNAQFANITGFIGLSYLALFVNYFTQAYVLRKKTNLD